MRENHRLTRQKIALVHLGISLFIAAAVALLVFKFWYPYPYGRLTGGLHLFLLVTIVDLICGPLVTFILANPKKSKRELMLDLSLVAVIQIAALGYGLYSVKEARPVVLSFEADRMVVVTEAEVDKDDLANAPKNLNALPWYGMQKVGLRKANNEKEFFESINLSFKGIEPSIRPSWWRPFDEAVPLMKEKMMAVSKIKRDKLDKSTLAALDEAVAETSMPYEGLFYLPLVSKHTQNWIVLMNQNADFVGYAPINGFDLKESSQ